jgi:cysteinyl-tRNA synthetase
MALRLYNTLTGRKEVFKPAEKGVVRLYTCGPTVYDYAHIGNFRTFVFQDLLRRWLRYRGYRVVQVMNITDVDEKTIERARRLRRDWRELAKEYEEAFFEDIARLNIQRAEYYPRTSEHIGEVVELTRKLMKAGVAFKAEDGSIYLDITRVDYGRLSGLKPKARLRAKSRREDYRTPKHFVLWKAWDEKDRDMAWNTELGKGRPGWHVECATLALKYLGNADIHSGGVDLVFPHHENTLALCEAAKGEAPRGYWLHVEHLTAHGEKMSKSRGNYYTLKGLMRKGYDPRAVRLFLLSEHYRERADFTLEKLEKAEEKLRRLEEFRSKLKSFRGKNAKIRELVEEAKKGFKEALDDDLNAGQGIEVLLDFVAEAGAELEKGGGGEEAKDFLEEVDRVLGLVG